MALQTFKEELIPKLLKALPKISRGGKTFKLFLRSQHYYYCQPDKDIAKKENYRPISLVNIDAKILNKILANWIQQYIKKIIYHDQVRFIPGM